MKFDLIHYHFIDDVNYLFFMFDVIPPLQNSKTGEDQKYISFEKTKRVLLLLHLRGKNFQKYKNKIQIYSLQNTILLTTTIAIAKNYNNSTVWRDFFVFLCAARKRQSWRLKNKMFVF